MSDVLVATAIWAAGSMVALWALSLVLRDASIVDVFWGLGFILLAWFYATPAANDLALAAKVGRETCRGLESGAVVPEPLES